MEASFMEKRHHYFLDYIRVVGTCFVVFMHATAGALRFNAATPGENWHLLNAATSLAFCAVPLFFMISGYLLFTSRNTPDVPYLFKKRIPRLLVPLIVYSFLSALWLSINSAEGFHLTTALKTLAAGINTPVMVHFWFMYTLIAMYLASPILYGAVNGLNASGKKYLFWLIVAAMGLCTLTAILPQSIRAWLPFRFFSELLAFSNYICALLLGWLFGQTGRKISNRALIIVAVADWALITFMTYRLTVQSGAYTATWQAQSRGFELILAVCLFLLFKQNLNRPLGRLNRWITPIASLTFPIYLVHNLLISIFSRLGFPALTAPQVLALTLSVLVLAWLLVKTAATVKPVCYLFTGLSYEEACRTCNWVYTFKHKE